ncbi:hypothetical protein CCACVL1_19427 [Corchorus capsularis]|uniref:Uncharacterized protein n=1 Tax=Corchorus capsularis TaxID=210143 RepID=A0A1R3HGY2_COCAP|nr:hypothetical protein CCACVL1_19427 [Corchorus capsularis]
MKAHASGTSTQPAFEALNSDSKFHISQPSQLANYKSPFSSPRFPFFFLRKKALRETVYRGPKVTTCHYAKQKISWELGSRCSFEKATQDEDPGLEFRKLT